ncbi:hypothetical protein CAOG_009256 [Capsaspora owczarzaki ATCC 30864]|uniref:Uncharacterized protein n=1 Tax=Capsaspora owczarzaki (strain ATCC 30864) TaxID=595528 RepID=A0A0D2WHS6_CAPO3|nr:hypothetical protein CAOG_009256 [Capsaspora owczarzaki ATCC 30864]
MLAGRVLVSQPDRPGQAERHPQPARPLCSAVAALCPPSLAMATAARMGRPQRGPRDSGCSRPRWRAQLGLLQRNPLGDGDGSGSGSGSTSDVVMLLMSPASAWVGRLRSAALSSAAGLTEASRRKRTSSRAPSTSAA